MMDNPKKGAWNTSVSHNPLNYKCMHNINTNSLTKVQLQQICFQTKHQQSADISRLCQNFNVGIFLDTIF